MPAPKDITNMRFNHLVAVEKAQSRGKKTYWKFRCDCGNEKEIMTCHVIDETVKSCGCDMFKKPQSPTAKKEYKYTPDTNRRLCKI